MRRRLVGLVAVGLFGVAIAAAVARAEPRGAQIPSPGPGVGPTEDEPVGPLVTLPLPDRRWIFIDKSDRRMVVHDRRFEQEFRVALGPNPIGDKEQEGDGRTPEGDFYVCRRVREDRFDRFLGLSYPDPSDAERGLARGLIDLFALRAIRRAYRASARPPWDTALGGAIGIHGFGNRSWLAQGHPQTDWTDGCIGVTNEEIELIYPHVLLGTRVVIVP